MSNKILIGVFTSIFLISFTVKAVDVEIQINGAILGQSCNVNSQDLTKNVNFPDIDPSIFKSIGTYTDSQELKINLRNCTGNVSKISYMVTGDLDDLNPNLFKIKGATSSATNTLAQGLGIEILDINNTIISPNTKTALNRTITTTNYDLVFYLRYKSTLPEVISGDASSVLYLDIYYD